MRSGSRIEDEIADDLVVRWVRCSTGASKVQTEKITWIAKISPQNIKILCK